MGRSKRICSLQIRILSLEWRKNEAFFLPPCIRLERDWLYLCVFKNAIRSRSNNNWKSRTSSKKRKKSIFLPKKEKHSLRRKMVLYSQKTRDVLGFFSPLLLMAMQMESARVREMRSADVTLITLSPKRHLNQEFYVDRCVKRIDVIKRVSMVKKNSLVIFSPLCSSFPLCS